MAIIGLESVKKLPNGRPVDAATARLTIEKIEIERRLRAVPAEALARRAGISVSTYARYVAGRRLPGARHMRALARALAMPPDRVCSDPMIVAALVGLETIANGMQMPAGLKPEAVKIYVGHVELGLEQRQLARLLNYSPAWISSVVRTVEQARDCAKFDKAIDAVGMTLRVVTVSHLVKRHEG